MRKIALKPYYPYFDTVCVQNDGAGQGHGADPVPSVSPQQRTGRDTGGAQDGLSGASTGAL